jgi:hypothetical protein
MTTPATDLPVLCAECGEPIRVDQVVTVNGRKVHPDPCFAAALRRLKSVIADLEVELTEDMPPMDAYRLGKTTVAVIVAERRKAKRR